MKSLWRLIRDGLFAAIVMALLIATAFPFSGVIMIIIVSMSMIESAQKWVKEYVTNGIGKARIFMCGFIPPIALYIAIPLALMKYIHETTLYYLVGVEIFSAFCLLILLLRGLEYPNTDSNKEAQPQHGEIISCDSVDNKTE